MSTIYLIRNQNSGISTQGALIIPGAKPFFTLEPASPIAEGTYELMKYFSPHFNEDVLLLKNIPNHTYVEIHPGNTAQDTRDCILVGLGNTENAVLFSREAFKRICTYAFPTMEKGTLYIQIINQIPIKTL